MTSERIDWVEIIEPRTKEHIYANLTTGDCVWAPPEGVNIKRADSSQWWELFDSSKTQRFYYYNVATQTTVWHRPTNCDIIPLAKLQILKQNTDPNDRKDNETQTGQSKMARMFRTEGRCNTNPRQHSSTASRLPLEMRTSDLLGSPQGRHSYRQSSSAGETSSNRTDNGQKYCRHTQGSRSNQKHLDSGKSSDSSISSAHGYRRLQEGGSLRIGSNSHQQRKGAAGDSSYVMLQGSSSSHNIPHVAIPIVDQKHSRHQQYPTQMLSYSISNSSDLAGCVGSGGGAAASHSVSTPQLKKKLSSETSLHGTINSNILKHQSFDYSGTRDPSASISLTRSGSFMSSSGMSARHQPQSSNSTISQQRAASIDGNGASDDSMHEKYFKSVENTPVSRRRQTVSNSTSNTTKLVGPRTQGSSDSSPHSPTSPHNHSSLVKTARPTLLKTLAMEQPSSFNSSHKNEQELLNLDLTSKPERYLDKMKLDKTKIISPSATSNSSVSSTTNLIKKSLNKNISPSSQQKQQTNEFNIQQFLTKPNLERHNKEKHRSSTSDKTSTHNRNKQNKKQNSTMTTGTIGGGGTSDVEYDNGNISPLYTNWDQEMQEHLLPLQHYILEQAKLSGCYRLGGGGSGGDPQDSDSFHSDSQSEHSFSGHEPDNEDSDHSDGRGDYLTHNYVVDDYGAHRGGATYFNVDFDKNEREDISEAVEACLENAKDDQIYSPVTNHPFFQPSPIRKPINFLKDSDKLQLHLQQQILPKSILTFPPQLPSISHIGPPPQLAIMKECDIEKFAQDNLNLHSKGIFRKKSSVRDMLSWTPDAISRPMLALSRDKNFKKMACELFKLVQIYMGDRKARAGMSLNSVALDIISMAVANQHLRDELFVQLCRQTTENPMRESLMRGWELLAICLSFIPPSPTFQPALLNYMNRHRDPTFATSFPEVGKWPIHVQISHYATIACRRLDKIGSSGKKQAKKPSEDEVNQSRDQIFRDSMFGNTIAEVMELQKERFPERQLPWIQITLSEQVLLLSGKQTEGIFRVSADVDEVINLKTRLDRWEIPEHKCTMDSHTPASLLKLWYRELYDPLIPDELYNDCVQTEDPDVAAKIIDKLPRLNRLVLTYLIHFLQQFSQPDVVANTKMDSSNLAMVFAPNCLRCTSQDPKVLLENARKEMTFIRTLILHMDTKSVAYMV